MSKYVLCNTLKIVVVLFFCSNVIAVESFNKPDSRPIQQPRVTNVGARQIVAPGMNVINSIHETDRTFRLLRRSQYDKQVYQIYNYLSEDSRNQLPNGVTGDFNKDGKTDIALMGMSQNNSVVIYVALATEDPEKYKVQKVYEWKSRDDVNLWRDIGDGNYRVTNWPYFFTTYGK